MPGWGGVLTGLGSLLGAGAGIAGMFRGDEDNYHPEVWRNQATHDRMREARDMDIIAKQYGFHPLALLGQHYGGQGFAQPVGAGRGGSMIGDAMSGAAQAFATAGELYQDDADRQDAIDMDNRAEMDRIAENVIRSDQRERENALRDAEIKRLDSETMLNAARTRSELSTMRAGALNGVGPMSPTVNYPYSGSVGIKPGSSTAQEAENVHGEWGQWRMTAEQMIWELMNSSYWDPLKLGHPSGMKSPNIGPDAIMPPPIY